jgi:tyrosyl-tRNA synthetase
MTQSKSEFLRAAGERGFIHQCTDTEALDARAAKGPITAYIGFDATADSLHAGSLVPIMLLRLLQQTGHRPIVLMGGGTTKVGDPSGKDTQRQLLSEEKIASNIAGIRGIFEKFLTFGDGPTDAVMVNNADWLDNLAYIDFLRDYGSHFSVNRMLSFDSVKLRLDREQPLSFLEFNYMVLQSYDFLELARRHGCCLQMGGSDQWGNIVSGVDLGRRIDQVELFGLTSPLLTTASGAKMGKTASGAVWLNADRLSPYEYWQYWRNTHDDDVGRFLRLFTDLPLDEIARLEKLEGAEMNDAKKILANEATALCHSAAEAEAAAETARRTFEEGTIGEDLPSMDIPKAEIDAGIPLYELMRRLELAASNGEARRLIKGGGARLNDDRVGDEKAVVTLADVNTDGVIKLSAGRKRHALVRPV